MVIDLSTIDCDVYACNPSIIDSISDRGREIARYWNSVDRSCMCDQDGGTDDRVAGFQSMASL